MACIKFHHASNSSAHQALLCIELCWVAHRVLLCCALSCATLQTLLHYVANYVAPCCIVNFITLHYLQILLHYIMFEFYYVVLQAPLHCGLYYITLCCTSSSIALWALLQLCCIVLGYDFVVLHCELYCVALRILLRCMLNIVVNFTTHQSSLILTLITCTHKNNN
jgi:hypothetical protein